MQHDDRGRPRPGQHVTGLPRGLDGDFLSLPIPGAEFTPGDAVPTINTPYRSRASGLLVPATSADHLHQDIDKLVAKLAQIDATIKNLRVREAELTGSPAASGPRRYYPVLVLTEGFPVNPVTLTMLRQRAEEAHLLVGDDTSALEVVDVTELEMLEGADLGAKSSAALARCNLRDFLIRERELRAGSPQQVRRHAQVAFDIAVRAVTPPSSTGAA